MAGEKRDINLKGMNSFGIDARAARLVSFTAAEELQELLAAGRPATESRRDVLGGGNNILFTGDYDGVLIHPEGGRIEIVSESVSHTNVRAEAGVVWDDFVKWCVEAELWGAENLSYIPSQVGAVPVQNIGAYGAEAGSIITSVETVDIATLKKVTLVAEYCSFGYRDSIFKHSLKGKAVITAVNFQLSKKPEPNLSYGALATEVGKLGGPVLENIRQAVINIRRSKLPEPGEIGNAGSFFKNPVVDTVMAEKLTAQYPGMPSYRTDCTDKTKLSAGWLIEKAGWKGVSRGNAGVYHKQALILVNNGRASGAEIIALANEIREDIYSRFGVAIEPEVNIW